MKNEVPFYSYSQYLKKRYGVSAYRVGIDAGFSCPNRGSERSSPGCSYCDVFGARAPYLDTKNRIRDQVTRTTAFLKRRYRAEILLLYFQAFTNTWAPVGRLKELYDYALGLEDFRELIVSTRPDCLPPEVVELLESYRNPERDVWVELGLQSSHERTLKRINRGHGIAEFEDGFNRLKEAGIKVAVHLIFGLPGEELGDILETIDFINRIGPDAVKIHNLHIPEGAPLSKEFLQGETVIVGMSRHLEYCMEALRRLSPEIVVMRFTCDTPRERCRIPGEIWAKSLFYDTLRKRMAAENCTQGMDYSVPE